MIKNSIDTLLNIVIDNSNFTKSKRSQAHVEIILATTLFIGFLVFVFVFLNSSLKTTQDIPTDKIQDAILDQVQQEIGKLSVVLGSDPKIVDADRCFDLGDVNDEYGADFRYIIDPSNPKRYTIYYGSFFEKNVLATCSTANRDFRFGGYIEENLVIEENIILLVDAYKLDYSKLKQDLGVDNFAFEFRDENNNILKLFSVKGKISDNVDIISKDFPVRVINNQAEQSNLILNIMAWR